jgi:hypothetical protein
MMKMGNHINENGRFQSDKYPELPENKIILSFKDPLAREVLKIYAKKTKDAELGEDILEAIKNVEKGSLK